MRIGIIGCDIVGLGFALLCEQKGFEVLISDTDENFLYNLNNKIVITDEPHIQSLLLDSVNLKTTTDNIDVIKNSDMIFTFVPTPPSVEEKYDTSKVFDVISNFHSASSLGVELYNKKFVVCSTTNPGDVEQIQQRLSMFNIQVSYNPSTVSQGEVISGFRNPKLVIIGTDYSESIIELTSIYNKIKESSINIYSMSIRAAEITKIGINGFLATKIAYGNMMGDLMNKIGLEKEIDLVLNAIGGDDRIGTKYLKYGFGFGGPSIPKSSRALVKYSKEVNLDSNLLSSVNDDNDRHVEFLKNNYIKINTDKSVPFILNTLGYKPSSNSVDESIPLKLCVMLLDEGYMVYCKTTKDIIGKLSSLSDNYQNRLKFIGPNAKIEGYTINL